MERLMMLLPKPCLACGTPTTRGSYCPTHASERERQRALRRGSAEQRGYGKSHRAERRRWLPIVASGQAYCAHCGGWIDPHDPDGFDLDHDPDDRTQYLRPSHRRCNRGAGR